MPWIDRYWVSRMRENRPSGLKRGEAAASAAPLLLDFITEGNEVNEERAPR
jgi:hypothetical protein